MNKIYLSAILTVAMVSLMACSDDDMPTTGEKPSQDIELAPKVVATLPEADLTSADTLESITVTYDKAIFLPPVVTIEVNGEYVDSVVVKNGNTLEIPFDLKGNTTYTVTITKPSVRDENYNFAATYTFSFSTKAYNKFDASAFDIATAPVTANPTEQATKLYNYLRQNFGKRVLTAATASSALDTEMADKIYEMTGKYPVINSFDFLHHINSAPLNPTDWMDYTDMSSVEKWWNDGGVVAFSWHWNVPCTEADKDDFTNYAFYCNGAGEKNTDFNAANATIEGTWEKAIVDRDLETIAGYLLALQDKGIPVIWRPLHEAAGNVPTGGKAWFWWGNAGAEAYKALWKYMFNYFQAKGLRNLLWVWTSQTDDADWYPGDEYVDIISRDYYEQEESKFHLSLNGDMAKLLSISSKKMLALGECGAMPSITNMLEGGDMWSWVMPWNGDYTTNSYYNSEAFFKQQYDSEYVITRDSFGY